MDIKPRKAVKKSKSKKEIRNRAGENGYKDKKSSKKVQNHPEVREKNPKI